MKKFSCIIPSYNEQEILPHTLPPLIEAVKNITSHKGRIVVVDNNSSDDTAKIAASFGIEVAFEPINQISKARNRGGHSCLEEDYLFFVDADTVLRKEILIDALKLMDEGTVCGGGCLIKLENNRAPLVTALWSIFSRCTNLAAGAFIFCTNEAFKQSGGFSEEIYAAEDVHFSSRLKKWGRKNGRLKFKILTQHKIVTSDRKFKWYSSFELLKVFLIIGIMPWRLKNKEKLGFWYNRPASKNDTNESHEVKENNSQ
ncbi:MAG: glycosyltransferase [Lentisphaeraceae bacterium]|nr:glycosyltransferase [Lentisphaeraceae bacterium]